MTLTERRIDEACTKVFAEYRDITMAAGAGANAAFRFLADNIVSELGTLDDLEVVYRTLYARVSLAAAGVGTAWEEQRHIAATAFKLGLECGKSVNAVLRQKELSLKAVRDQVQDTTPASLWKAPEGTFLVKDGERVTTFAGQTVIGYSQVGLPPSPPADGSLEPGVNCPADTRGSIHPGDRATKHVIGA